MYYEFAGLIGVPIERGAERRRGLIESGLLLTRTAMDSGILRDTVWDAKIVTKFNDAGFSVSLSLNSRVHGADPYLALLSYGPGSKLLSVFNRSMASL